VNRRPGREAEVMWNLAAVAADVGEAHVVDQNGDDVWTFD
jgi:hypothetical protein